MPVTVLIVTHNRLAFLQHVVKQIELQLRPGDELLVIDDGSVPPVSHADLGTPDLLRLVCHSESLGYIVRRNEGFQSASNEIVLQLDDDSWPVTKDAFGKAEAICQQFPSVGAFALPVHYHHGKAIDECGRPDPRWQSEHLSAETAFMGCAGLLRRSAFLAAGGYPLYCSHGFEETVLCTRILAKRIDVRMNSEIRIIHGHEQLSLQKSYLLTRSDYRRSALAASRMCFIYEMVPTLLIPVFLLILRVQCWVRKTPWHEVNVEYHARERHIRHSYRMSPIRFLMWICRDTTRRCNGWLGSLKSARHL